jgi:hypothetical protein
MLESPWTTAPARTQPAGAVALLRGQSMRRFLLLLLLIGLTGCTQTLSESRKASVRNLAVISAIGDDVRLIRILGSGGEQKYERLPWNFDRIAAHAAVESVRAHDRGISLIPVDYDSNALADGIHKHESFKSFADPARIEPILRQLLQGKPIDTVILIARSETTDGGFMYVEGVGVMTERTVLPRAPVTPFAALALFVIDAPTMQVLSKETLTIGGDTYNVTPLIQFKKPAGPAPFLPGFTLPMTEEQKEFLRPRLQELVLVGTRELMRRSGF